ncbi:hypothetical protein NUK36_11675 [Aeromonas hydrophila]|nr:hypothetical protein [Aeromonas hydrophila]MCR3903478.1 hypothetical protein [Aeromonas hydrophila]
MNEQKYPLAKRGNDSESSQERAAEWHDFSGNSANDHLAKIKN